METNQENNDQGSDIENETESEQVPGKAKEWLRDNMRIIISILIVVLIAGGIYSYSKRTETSEKIAEIPATIEETENPSQDQESVSDNQQGDSDQQKSNLDNQQGDQQQTSSISSSQETEIAFIETASKGDSLTKLARRALTDYLEKNPDSSLTAEHKIYIKDFLRKNIQYKGRVFVGTSVEFGKDLIGNAIAKSKSLNDRQLQNLHKYAVRVPSLS